MNIQVVKGDNFEKAQNEAIKYAIKVIKSKEEVKVESVKQQKIG